ncbi:MAG: hypothetical protein ACR2QU_08195 [Gammaproteobacteria bacterium]
MTGQGEISKTPPVLTDIANTVSESAVPVLRDIVSEPSRGLNEDDLAALQTELTTLTRDLAEQLVGGALRDMQAALYEQLDGRLRDELPALIEKVLQDHLERKD